MIYLDYSANTPMDPAVLTVYGKTEQAYFGNPNSEHPAGLVARERLAAVTDSISARLGIRSGEIIYTSGASEANNLALKGIDIDSFLAGAAACDALGRSEDIFDNPALLLALAWYKCSGGQGGATQVVLPYKDSLMLFAKYLQQLIMESLGKEFDLDGREVHQGLAVMGNKGTSDQHSYVQQLVAGPSNIFVTFVQVLKDRAGASMEVGEGSTSGDYLNAFMLGTKKALEDHGKRTLVLTVPEVNAYHVGQLIAVFERAVSIYAIMIHINAYHQPAVEFGKKAAGGLIDLKNKAAALLRAEKTAMTAKELAAKLGADESDVFRLMLHLCSNDPGLTLSYQDPVEETVFSAK